MSRKGITVEIDDREVQLFLNKYITRLQNPRPLLKTMQRYLLERTMKMFSGTRADTAGKRGVRWPKLAPSTRWAKAAARKRGEAIEAVRPLVRTGAFRDSIKTLKEERLGFTYGTRQRSKKGFPYPGVHNVGGAGGRPPQRKWLFINATEMRQLVKMTVSHIKGKGLAKWAQ